MTKIEEYQLHPLGWENDPEEERFKLSTLDYLSAMTYNNYALFFKLDDSEKSFVPLSLPPQKATTNHPNSKVASVLKQGLELTLPRRHRLP